MFQEIYMQKLIFLSISRIIFNSINELKYFYNDIANVWY